MDHAVCELPLQHAVGIDGIEVVVKRADINSAVGANCRRGEYRVASCKLPSKRAIRLNRVEVMVQGADINVASAPIAGEEYRPLPPCPGVPWPAVTFHFYAVGAGVGPH